MCDVCNEHNAYGLEEEEDNPLSVRKSLEIIRCSQCHHRATGAYRYYCMHPQLEYDMTHDSSAPLSNRIPDNKKIPDFCRLPDYPEE